MSERNHFKDAGVARDALTTNESLSRSLYQEIGTLNNFRQNTDTNQNNHLPDVELVYSQFTAAKNQKLPERLGESARQAAPEKAEKEPYYGSAKPSTNEGRRMPDRENESRPDTNLKQREEGRRAEPKPRAEEHGRKAEPKPPSSKDCEDFGSKGREIMKKPVDWKPDTELKTKEAQEWNKRAQELRDKPLKTDANGKYEVKAGDSLWGIAERSLKERTGQRPSPKATFEEMQRIVGMNADTLGSQSNWQMIKPGMKLRVKADNNCEVPGQANTPKGEAPPRKRGLAVDRDEVPRAAEVAQPKQSDGPAQKQGEVPQQNTERTSKGDKGQTITVDAQNRVSKLEYPNGLKVNLEYGADSNASRITVSGNGQDVVLVRDGNGYKVIENGRETKDRIEKIEIRKDGSAVLTGTKDVMGAKIRGQKVVNTDGTTRDVLLSLDRDRGLSAS